MLKKVVLFLFAGFLINSGVWGQDFGFGFADEEETGGAGGSGLSVSISGEASAAIIGYVKDFSKSFDKVRFGDIFSGKINFYAGVSDADAFINLNIEPSEMPVTIDEAYLRFYFGNFDIEGGIRKLTWGRADAFGPMDVINPLDYSQLTDLDDLMNFKIARPLLRLSYRFGSFSKFQGVFVPYFEPMRFAEEGRWVQAQMAQMDGLTDLLPQGIIIPINKPDTSALNYAQAGLRFTTTIGPADIGAQYYYGRLTKPSIAITFPPSLPIPSSIDFYYNPYHQIGIDWGQVLSGFNFRAEFAANITEDLSGDDVKVYNPGLAWSFGFDRNLVWGINLNLQCNQSIRLMHNKLSKEKIIDKIPPSLVPDPGIVPDVYLDIEGGSDRTATQIIASLSKFFLRDQLELRAAVFWEVEAEDFMIVPSIVWTKDAVSVELSGGIFGGNSEGQFGQYKDNSFVKAAITYCF